MQCHDLGLHNLAFIKGARDSGEPRQLSRCVDWEPVRAAEAILDLSQGQGLPTNRAIRAQDFFE
jgi:hypothetical protein